MQYHERTYRNQVKASDLVKFQITEQESDLLIMAEKNLFDKTLATLLSLRAEIKNFAKDKPDFLTSYKPLWLWPFFIPTVIRNMAWAGRRAGVGPMASVAGALAELLGKELLQHSKEVIIENGRDIFIKTNFKRKIGIFANTSTFSNRLVLEINPEDTPCGVCTSSGTVGHFFSYGKADAVVVIAKSAALADAAATAIANQVKSIETIQNGLRIAKKIRGLSGVLIIKDDQLGVMGKIRLVSIYLKPA